MPYRKGGSFDSSLKQNQAFPSPLGHSYSHLTWLCFLARCTCIKHLLIVYNLDLICNNSLGMNHALRLASSRLSPVLRTHTTRSIAKQSCFQAYRPVTSSLIRSFSNSTPTRDEKDDPKIRDLSVQAEKRQMRKATTGSSAQTLENDRPWHRLSPEEEAEADENVGPSKPDPEKGTTTKLSNAFIANNRQVDS